jgi:hypothetical protein
MKNLYTNSDHKKLIFFMNARPIWRDTVAILFWEKQLSLSKGSQLVVLIVAPRLLVKKQLAFGHLVDTVKNKQTA